MRIVDPIPITEATLLASNIAENDADVWDDQAVYNIDDRAIFAHRVFESLIDGNTIAPDVGVAADPPAWLDVGATNRHRMFDFLSSASSLRTGSIAVTIAPGRADVLSLANISGTSYQVHVAAGGSVLYESEGTLQDLSGITGHYQYYYQPVELLSRLTLTDLPVVEDAEITVVLTGSQVRIGELLVGLQIPLGLLTYGAKARIKDFSRRTEDAFGNFSVARRGFSNRISYQLEVPTPQVGRVRRLLALRRSQPKLYIPADHRPDLVAFGFYEDFEIHVKGPRVSTCELRVQALAEEESDAFFADLTLMTPSVLTPAADSGDFTENATFETSEFTVFGGNDTHESTDWQISSSADFSVIDVESLADTDKLVQWQLPVGHGLIADQLYFLRVRHRGTVVGAGEWVVRSFVFRAAATIAAPTIEVPPAGVMLSNSQFSTSPFATSPSGLDTLQRVEWEFATDSGFTNVVLAAESETEDLDFPLEALPDGMNAFVRARHVGHLLPTSDFSAAVGFTVNEPAGQVAYTSDGTHDFVVPAGVRRISPVLIGPGGVTAVVQWVQNGTQPGTGLPVYEVVASQSPAGGGLRFHTGIVVAPGETLTVELTQSGDTRLLRGGLVLLWAGKGGQQNAVGSGSAIGGPIGGGNGAPGGVNTDPKFARAGGAGGYTGDGNTGAGGSAASGTANTGGNPASSSKHGGGVGLYGQGSSGAKFTGAGGSGGADGNAGSAFGGGRVYYSDSAGSVPSSQDVSARGAARIVWGTGRTYPDAANVGDV